MSGANALPYISRYDRAPLIRPILFKTAFYSVIVFLVRLLERFVHFTLVEHNRPRGFASYAMSTFSWDRFLAVNLWRCCSACGPRSVRESAAAGGASERR